MSTHKNVKAIMKIIKSSQDDGHLHELLVELRSEIATLPEQRLVEKPVKKSSDDNKKSSTSKKSSDDNKKSSTSDKSKERKQPDTVSPNFGKVSRDSLREAIEKNQKDNRNVLLKRLKDEGDSKPTLFDIVKKGGLITKAVEIETKHKDKKAREKQSTSKQTAKSK
jgi:hypothetical protein